ncbi:MAG: alpha-hydroxy-acid oxidizing protein [Hyphomicrobiaceae bacterium]
MVLLAKFKCGLEIENRFVIAPLTTNASHEDGTATDSEIAFFRRRAASGFGAVHFIRRVWRRRRRAIPGAGLRATHDGHLPRLRALADVKASRGRPGDPADLRRGRIAIPEIIGENRIRAASAIPSLRPNARTPRAMTSDEIESLVASFGRAATLARQAGFDGVEIHGANHYAVHQFFSPRANQRTDHWGGTLAKRMNFPIAVARAVRDALGPKLIAGFRVTPFEAEPEGYKLDDAKLLCDALAGLGLDYLSISLDDYRLSQPMSETRVYTVSFEQMHTASESPITAFSRVVGGRCAIMASGGIKTAADAEAAIELGADVVAIGRAVVVDPEWLTKVRRRAEASIIPGLPRDETTIADALSIPPRMVEYLLSRPGWIPRL